MVIFIFIFTLIGVNNVYCLNNFFEAGYFNSESFQKYSFTYGRNISTEITSAFNWIGWSYNDVDINSFRGRLSYITDNLNISINPVYIYKSNHNLFGFRLSSSINYYGNETVTTITLSPSYLKENYSNEKRNMSGLSFSFEKNFYDEFFIVFGGFLGMSGKGYNGFFDKTDFFFSRHNGYISSFPYSSVIIGFARSFKPDFNSYLYLSFNRINMHTDDLNSYEIGIRTYIDETENYLFDVSYNIADFKVLSNQKIWKFVISGFFNL